ncbi:relaxase/mobilization nuclease domain-containing protein [Roseovarius sp. Pro17]|uniref:relaxase/mobilization nuclease domain-containing protein n=1 Tax=Roseovarius sp. Pro17 TaxID=3108175 RepID=UPI002D76F30A|nr:relaxase/mobilization nuclease domain-containing protein [Roseovarius sp. Pro17]
MARANDGKKRSNERRATRQLYKRVTTEELADFKERADAAVYCDHQVYLTAFISGEVELKSGLKKDIIRVLGQLGKVGSNLNQIAHGINAGRVTDLEPDDLETLKEALAAVQQISAEIRQALGEMICKIIGKPGEKGSGGGRDAFVPGIRYVSGKAGRVELRNIASSRWEDAAEEMLLTSELSERVQKPYYHLVLSWHELEQPTDVQMVAAMEHLICTLGLEEHQIVIGTHDDTRRKHAHTVVNTIHPLTGKVWSKSRDHRKAEAACRQIELDQGWSHDRGRFDFDVIEKDGRKIAKLKKHPLVCEKKLKDRAAGKRPKTSGDLMFEKSTGFETFEHSIPDALRQKFATLVNAASGWQDIHTTLGAHGLTYYTFGSGARVGIIGSSEHTKASAFGAKFGITKMEKRFGPYAAPETETEYRNDLNETHVEVAALIGSTAAEDEKATSASAFKLTLLRRIYTDIHIDPKVAQAIRFVDFAAKPPQISFQDGSTVVDLDRKLSTSRSTMETRATMIAMAKAKGWASVRPTGTPEFIRQAALDCARAGLRIHGVPADIQALADRTLEQTEKRQRRIEQVAREMQRDHLADQTDREDLIEENMEERRLKALVAADITAEAQAVQEAIGFGRGPGPSALRKINREERDTWIASLPDMRTVSHPQTAPDTAKQDHRGRRRIAHQLRGNDHAEIEEMKRLDIQAIAGMGGWSDVSRTHPDSADRHGKTYRVFQRGGDTIKASLVEGKWLWTSNKSGANGSVIDLWLQDNPGRTLSHARAAFREIMGSAPAMALAAPAVTHDQDGDHTEARRRWEEAPHIDHQRSYAEARGIDRKTLFRFRADVRSGAFGGIYFAHRNPTTDDIQGFEQRWEKNGEKNKARFAKGGRKTVNVLGNTPAATRMIVFEGGLDALALAEIEDRSDTTYVSTGGGETGSAFGSRQLRFGTGKTNSIPKPSITV